jgi:ribonucleoside-diphosphate reductase alpha chain
MEFLQPISKTQFGKKYMINKEKSYNEVLYGIVEHVYSKDKKHKTEGYNILDSGQFIPGGRILANARPGTKMNYLMNCFVIPIEDSIKSIYNAVKECAEISQCGGGVGINYSQIRPKGDALTKGGEASGPISFMKVFNQSAKVIMTGGARRAALISILDVSHPDIEEFIACKRGDENKSLTQMNISVGITNDFMTAVENDTDWKLVYNSKSKRTIRFYL